MDSIILDERLEWPVHQWHHGRPWRLGHGLTDVGPGWWPLVRRAFEIVAEMPGAEVADVRQKCAELDVRLRHPDPAVQARLSALAAQVAVDSRLRCEACGGTVVSPHTPGRALWRNHCPACRSRLAGIWVEDPVTAERRLWEERAGLAWPWSEW